jgi:hypothetical protein
MFGVPLGVEPVFVWDLASRKPPKHSANTLQNVQELPDPHRMHPLIPPPLPIPGRPGVM